MLIGWPLAILYLITGKYMAGDLMGAAPALLRGLGAVAVLEILIFFWGKAGTRYVILEVNGVETVIPIDKGADSSRAVHLFQEEGMSFFINRNTGFFSLSLWGDRFDPGMIPRDNSLRIKMTMGDVLGEVTLAVTGHRDTYQRSAVVEEVMDHPAHR